MLQVGMDSQRRRATGLRESRGQRRAELQFLGTEQSRGKIAALIQKQLTCGRSPGKQNLAAGQSQDKRHQSKRPEEHIAAIAVHTGFAQH